VAAAFDEGTLAGLRDGLRGTAIVDGDEAYDNARTVFNAMIDRRPAVIVQCEEPSDVVRALEFARERGLEVAVRGGGHSVAGMASTDGGVVIDLRRMNTVNVDPEAQTAVVGGGATMSHLDRACDPHGLATTGGRVSTTGVGGFTLGGGTGWMDRKFGLACDNLLAAEVITADGQLLHVDDRSHPDLFWAIRGGGGNFGVATRFKFRLHPLDQFVGGLLLLPATPEVIADFVAEAQAAPEELSTIANVMPAPPLPFVPAEQRGRLVIMATLAYAGAVEDGQRAVAPFRALATPIADLVRPMPYPGIYPPEEEGFHPTAASRTMLVDAVDRDATEAIVEHLQASTASLPLAQLRVLGGAMARVPAEATAFAHRASRLMVNVAAVYGHPEDPEVHEAWVDRFAAVLRNSDARAYVNFLGDEGEARVREAYPGSTWERLAAIKARYDHTNLFHLNQNIPPTKADPDDQNDPREAA
jgi:FAD/FMN-containing dehydrogenase